MANVGKCWHKNLYSFKIGTFGSLKGAFKNLRKPYIKSYIDQKEVLREGGYNLSTMLFDLHAVTVHIFSCESKNVGKCECKNYI